MSSLVSALFDAPSDEDVLGALTGAQSQAAGAANINAGGLRSRRTGDLLTISSTPARQAQIGQLSAQFGKAARELGALRSQVRPGFGRLTDAARSTLGSARSRAIGDLRETLARRRLSGSSFAADTLARAEAEFAQAENELVQRSFLQELDLSTRLLERESANDQARLQTAINEMNLQAGLGESLSQAGLGILANLSQAQSALLRDMAVGAGATQARLLDLGIGLLA